MWPKADAESGNLPVTGESATCRLCNMSPEIWTIVGVGVAIAGLTLNSVRRLRVDLIALVGRLDGRMNLLDERMDRLDGRMDRLDGRMDRLEERMDRDKNELLERLARLDAGQGDMRERMAHLEGLLDGLREAITRAQPA